VFLLVSGPARALGDDPPSADELQKQIDGELQDIIRDLDVGGLQGQLDRMQGVPDDLLNLKPLIQRIASGQFRYMGSDILSYLLDSAKQPLSDALLLFGELLLLIVVSGVLAQLTNAFSSEGAAKIANLVVYAAAAIVIVNALVGAVKTTNGAIEGLLNVSQGVFPVLSMMLAATGGLASTAVLQPAWSIVINTASWLTREALIPAALYGGALAVVGNLTDKGLLKELGSLVRGAGVWIAGAVMTVFVAIAAIQGSAAVSYDGISFRAAKYAVDSMVPYIGGMFSDMADTFVGCTLLVRNAVGMAGLLMMVVAIIRPLLLALGVYFAFKLAAAMSGAFESKQLCAVMNESAKVVMLLVVVMMMCFAMLFFMTTMTINAGNSILSMR
jgi:stage III sporulation protein AE